MDKELSQLKTEMLLSMAWSGYAYPEYVKVDQTKIRRRLVRDLLNHMDAEDYQILAEHFGPLSSPK